MADADGITPELARQIIDFFESEGVVIGREVFHMTIDIGPSPAAIEFMDEVQAAVDNLIETTDHADVPVTYEIDVTYPTPEEA